MSEQNVDRSRRAFLTKVAYTAPLIVTLSVMPSIASAGSGIIRKNFDGIQRQRLYKPDGSVQRSKWYWR